MHLMYHGQVVCLAAVSMQNMPCGWMHLMYHGQVVCLAAVSMQNMPCGCMHLMYHGQVVCLAAVSMQNMPCGWMHLMYHGQVVCLAAVSMQNMPCGWMHLLYAWTSGVSGCCQYAERAVWMDAFTVCMDKWCVWLLSVCRTCRVDGCIYSTYRHMTCVHAWYICRTYTTCGKE
jgi:hypothetical protein